MLEGNMPTGVIRILLWLLPVGLIVLAYFALQFFYSPRSSREWRELFRDPEARKKLRVRRRRLNAIRNRRPGSILPGIPTSQRDFALEPLIRNGQFRAARHYIMEQIRHHRDSPEGNGRMRVYVQYLELIEGAS
jgi:hypothetical protein